MKVRLAVSFAAVFVLLVAVGAPATGARRTNFGLAGEARGLDLAIGQQGVTLGLALTRGDSRPLATGLGAGRCTLLRDIVGLEGLPCADETTETSRAPGRPGDGAMSCATGSLPAGLDDLLNLRIACGLSRSTLRDGLPVSTNVGRVAALGVDLPLSNLTPDVEQARRQLVDQLAGSLRPLLGAAPAQGAVDQLLDSIESLGAEAEAVKVELGSSSSNIRPGGDLVNVGSTAAGALIGVLGVPQVVGGEPVAGTADPLRNGLLIIEVGKAVASASVNRANATATSAADPALLRIRLRNITQPGSSYIEVPIAPGETITLFEGTPLESTIVAADSSIQRTRNSARAAADAVSLHLLKGVANGGVRLALGRATAAANVEAVRVQRQERAPTTRRVLPVTGGRSFVAIALVLLLGAGIVLVARRFLTSR